MQSKDKYGYICNLIDVTIVNSMLFTFVTVT